MATSTDVPIYSYTLPSDAANFTIDLSAYQQYTDLKMVVSAGSTQVAEIMVCQVGNGTVDTGSNYSCTYLLGNGSAASSGRFSNATYAAFDRNLGVSSVVGEFMSTVHFMNYSNTNMYKTIIARGNQTNATYNGAEATVNLWRSNSAINTIKVFMTGGNIKAGSTFNIYGIGTASPAKATGGAIYSDSNYWYHVFTNTAAFVPTQALTADVLCVAGGGGGWAGAGGAGGHVLSASQSFASGTTYTCTVGAGGAKYGSSGTNSNLTGGALSLTAAVGGGYGGGGSGMAGGNGGSGGGGGWGYGAAGSGTAGQGYAGGVGSAGGGGAGGGAGGAASNPNGGPGISTYSSGYLTATAIGDLSGTTYYIASGGGWPSSVGGGGYAGAGKRATGGGGGGDSDGGSGFIIVRYAR